MEKETRNLLLLLTGVFMWLSHRYLGTRSIIIDGYIISYVLGLLARKVVEPKEKGREVLSIDDVTVQAVQNDFYGLYNLFGSRGQKKGLIVMIIIIAASIGLGAYIDIVNEGGIQAYTYTIAGILMSIDIYLYYRKVGIKVYEKGIQRGFLFYKWKEIEITENYKGTELTYVRNLVFKERIVINEGVEEIKSLKKMSEKATVDTKEKAKAV